MGNNFLINPNWTGRIYICLFSAKDWKDMYVPLL